MARIRSIKPEFWTDSRIVALSPLARLFYIGMWNFAVCDMGHVKDDPDALRLQILPTDDVDGRDLVDELLKSGRCVRLTLPDGRSYLHIPRFTDHQNLSFHWSPRCAACKHESGKSSNDDQHRADVTKFEETSPKMLKEGKGREGKGKEPSSPAERATDDQADTTVPLTAVTPQKRGRTDQVQDDPMFIRFWDAYPRKIGKGEARKVWARIVKAGVDPKTIIVGAERYRDDPQRRRKGAEFTKHPGPWLNAERWTDQLADGDDLAPSAGWWNN